MFEIEIEYLISLKHTKQCENCKKFISIKNEKFCSRKCNRVWHNTCSKKIKKTTCKRINTNTIYTKKSDLDQFYTSPEIAKHCFYKINEFYDQSSFDIFFEPAAGTGAFFNLFPEDKKTGIDLDPKCSGVQKLDFFDYEPPRNVKIATIGNPPFGKNANLAIKFFNKAADFSNIIAFIIPKTFQKQSVQNKLNLNFHLKYNEDLPKYSFILNNEKYDVPCCFQIWERSKEKRKIETINLENDYFSFTNKKNGDIAVRRVGGRTGKATDSIKLSSETSHYFLAVNDKKQIETIIKVINSIDFGKTITATSGVKSLSKPEFIKYFTDKINETRK